LVRTAAEDDPDAEEIKTAAASQVARVEGDDRYFSPDSPANENDDL